jgi:CheY-like chemotaxis protein
MRFPIDALFLDRDLRVLDVVEQLGPWRVASKRRAHAVLELAAGELARHSIEVGDVLELRERSPVSDAAAAAAPAPAQSVAPASESVLTSRLHPLHVLVVSPDLRFRIVMSLLLARRNCSVTTTADEDRLGDHTLRERVDVVVLDTGRPAVAMTIAKVRALTRPMGMVLVSGEDGSQPPGILAKWGPFDELFAAIEGANAQRSTAGVNGDRG